ncbi:MAG: hypothetical protein A3J52_03820 [Omnitrophica bacterium RIFCSPHIGHO2_02_FULL_49_9]|nr:MAG: hypothetical protein A3J52_03820 [Omnitrophica bacterium RIFCSPHIGHO2_02_FULL_49_9]OGW88305.1 MAG: hypothetical protein A3A73_01585 [Omnitrophica bacterium RIFCSPLOWO2_01_FULL_50_24]
MFFEGNVCERVFIVRSGRVKVYRMSSSGREQTLEILEPGETCACNPGSEQWSCSATAEAMTRTAVWYLARQDYLKMIKDNLRMSQTLNQLFAERIKCFSCLIEEVSLKDAKKRLIKFLLDMLAEERQEAKGKAVLDVPFTREEIAQRIGTARETVARHLSQLKETGLIDIGQRKVIIRNQEGLKKLLS